MEERRILMISVEGLFNRYNHKVELQEGGVTIIFGQNGVGKTILLSMIDSFFNKKFSFFEKIPFYKLIITTTKEILTIEKKDKNLECTCGIHKEIIKYSQEDTQRIARRIGRDAPFLDQIGPDSWVDLTEGEIISSVEVVSRYGENDEKLNHAKENNNYLENIIDSINVFFIKTQRLERENKLYGVHPFRRTPTPDDAVNICSKKMKNILGDALANYAKLSQQLDKTFPNRLLARDTTILDGGDLKIKMENIEKRRKQLAEMQILPSTEEEDSISYGNLNIDELEEHNRRVLTTYAEDSEKKLGSLNDISKKIQLMLDKINNKFQNKRISVSAEDGVVLHDSDGTVLNLSNLSSGEQHELVLMFNLLFNTKKNSLILIDEPEISLHIQWQKNFIKDLMEIISVSNIDVIVATHSPSICEGYRNIMQELAS